MSQDQLKETVERLGYQWGSSDDDWAGQVRTLLAIVNRADYWRKQYEDSQKACFAERQYQHLQERYVATRNKLRNLRKAHRVFMANQTAFCREVRAEMVESLRNPPDRE